MAIGYHAAFVPVGADADRRLRLALDWLSSEDIAESQERLVATRSQALLRRVRSLMRYADDARLVTEQTAHDRWWSGGPLLLVEPTDRFFREWIDDHRPTAMCVVPGTGVEIEAWARASRAINLADPQAEVAEPELDPVAAEAMVMLTKPALVNITSLGLDEDKAWIVVVLEELRKAAVPFDPTSLEAWALANEWSPQAARVLAKLAEQVFSGHRFVLREKPPALSHWTILFWRERAKRRAEHGGTLPEETQ